MSASSHQDLPIAIVATSALFSDSPDEESFWQNILQGKDLFTEVPATHWIIDDFYDPDPTAIDKTYCKRGSFLPDVNFDPLEFGIPPNILPVTDTAQLIALMVSKRVLQEASQGNIETADFERTSVILGTTGTQELLVSMAARLQRPIWVKALREKELPESKVQAICDRIAEHYTPWQESTFPGLLGNVIAGRICNRFNLGGTNCIIDAACASSLAAINAAVNELQLYKSDMVLTGGVDTLNDILMYMCFSKTPALSKTDDCRPLSAQADGTMMGEGFAMFALKRLADAEQDGNHIYAVIRGVGTSSDGRSKSVYAPSAKGQAKALRRAYHSAGYHPNTVELVEAHGTSTKAGDIAEFNGLAMAFADDHQKQAPWCALGSVKSQVGHTKAAAGSAGLFKIIMALHHKVLPPTIKVDRPNPDFNIEKSPFYLNTQLRPWIRDQQHPRRAGVSSFGFGGSNFHITVEEYQGNAKQAPRFLIGDQALIVFQASDTQALIAQLQQQRSLLNEKNITLAQWARQTQQALSVKNKSATRLAFVANSLEQATQKLNIAVNQLMLKPDQNKIANDIYYNACTKPGKVAFVFPGQGSQSLNMGKTAALEFASARAVWDQAATLLNTKDVKFHDIVFPPPSFDVQTQQQQQVRLLQTQYAQPAIATVSLSLLSILQQLQVKPDCVAGHSFGEVMALHAAGAFDFNSCLQLSQIRGQIMADVSASTSGAMSAVIISQQKLQKLLQQSAIDVTIANINAPQQVVISGKTSSVEKAEALLLQQGIHFKRLPVATAFHSSIVSKAATSLATSLKAFKWHNAKLPVYANTHAKIYPNSIAKMQALLANQLAHPVQFQAMIDAMYAEGVRTFIEVGPGNVLTRLIHQNLQEQPHCTIALEDIWQGLAQCFVAGVNLNFNTFWQDIRLCADEKSPAPSHAVTINGANYKKPYPSKEAMKQYPKPNSEQTQTEGDSAVTQPQHPMDQQLAVLAQMQQEMTKAHMAFLNTMQTTMAALSGQPSVTQQEAPISPQSTTTSPLMPAPLPVAAMVPMPVALTPATASTVVAPTSAAPLVPPMASAVASVAVAPSVATVAQPGSAMAITPDLQAIMLTIVAEKTGYPIEMLKMNMELEADLGIDSIKRVEILSAVQTEIADLPELDPMQMSSLQTLGEIADYIAQHLSAQQQPASATTTTLEPASAHAANLDDLQAILLTVVAEKTGYPQEMLGMSMELEADLGIDSIKRVEILSAMQSQVPNLPEMDPTEMAALNTLAEIATYMKQQLSPVDNVTVLEEKKK